MATSNYTPKLDVDVMLRCIVIQVEWTKAPSDNCQPNVLNYSIQKLEKCIRYLWRRY